MIKVIITKKHNVYELSMNGHANYAPSGSDIVCAAASTLAYTLWGFLENCSTVIDLETIERSGEIEISCTGDKVVCKTGFFMAVIGFLQLEKNYPKNVSVEVSGFH